MVEEQDAGPRPGQPRVVKKVVKKTVARPVPAPPRSSSTATKSKARRPARPTLDLGSRLGSARSRGAGALRTGADAVRRGSGTARQGAGDRLRAVAAWRIPTLNPFLAAAVTGALLGLLVSTLGWLSMLMFWELRGTSSGGGLWGGLTVLAIVGLTLALGSWLLSAFGAPAPRLTVFLALVIVLVVVLLAFVDLAATGWAFLLLPVLGAAAHVAAAWLLDLAEREGSPVS